MSTESVNEFYTTAIAPHADKIYSYVFGALLNSGDAERIVINLFKKVAGHAGSLEDESNILRALLDELWPKMLDSGVYAGSESIGEHEYSQLGYRERCVWLLAEYLGYDISTVAEITKLEKEEVITIVAAARKEVFGDLHPDPFFMAHVGDYTDGSLGAEEQKKFDELMSGESFHEQMSKYSELRGNFQSELSEFKLTMHGLERIETAILTHDAQMALEDKTIHALEAEEGRSQLLRRVFALAAALYVSFLVYDSARTPPAKDFNFLSYIEYETNQLIVDREERLNFDSDSDSELLEYFSKLRNLGYKFDPPTELGQTWKGSGGSIIDYGEVKVAVVEYSLDSNPEKLFMYVYPGKVEQFSQDSVFLQGDRKLYAFRSEALNAVAWQFNSNLIAFLAGPLGAEDLAKLTL